MNPRRDIVAHTSLRGIAATLVVAYHLQFSGYHLPIEDTTAFFRKSYLFVDLFFILSGFIISYVYAEDFKGDDLNLLEIGRFFAKRIARLYPLVLFCLSYFLICGLILTAAFWMIGKSSPVDWSVQSPERLLEQLAMINVWASDRPAWNIPSWSISAELLAYALFPFMIRVGQRFSYIAAFFGLLLSSAFYLGIVGKGSLDVSLGLGALRCLAGFILGMLAFASRNFLDFLETSTLTLLQITAIVAICIVLSVPLPDVAAVPFFVILVAGTYQDRGAIAQALGRSIWRYFGRISYSVYLNHVPISTLLAICWTRLEKRIPLSPDLERIIWLLLYMAAVIVVSHWTHNRVEEPGRRALSRLFGSWLRPARGFR